MFLTSAVLKPRTGTCCSCGGCDAPHALLFSRAPPCPAALSRLARWDAWRLGPPRHLRQRLAEALRWDNVLWQMRTYYHWDRSYLGILCKKENVESKQGIVVSSSERKGVDKSHAESWS
jgi:hypothetical protein